MANSVTHVLIVIVLLDLLRHYVFGKKYFPRYLVVVGGVAGLLPDFDIIITGVGRLFFGFEGSLHGEFTHSIVFVVVFFLLGLLFREDFVFKHVDNRRKWSSIMFVIAFGWLVHLSLDCLYGGYKSFIWPLEMAVNFCPEFGLQKHAADIDAILLILWIVHEEIHGRVKDWF